MLTQQQYKVWALLSVGFSADEIADKLCIEPATARKHIDNVKKEVGLSKNTELSAEFICQHYGGNLDDFKKKILAAVLVCIMVFSINPYLLQNTTIRNRRAQRTQLARVVRLSRREAGNLFELIPKVV